MFIEADCGEWLLKSSSIELEESFDGTERKIESMERADAVIRPVEGSIEANGQEGIVRKFDMKEEEGDERELAGYL